MMAHKVLSADMQKLIEAMKLAQQYSTTIMDVEYRKRMLQAAHILAVDSKNLLDAVDHARLFQMSNTQSKVKRDSSSSLNAEGSTNQIEGDSQVANQEVVSDR